MKNLADKSNNLKNHLLACLIICVLIINGFAYKYWYSQTISQDEKLYHAIALALLNGQNTFLLEEVEYDIGQFVTPFYSAIIALTYYIAGIHPSNVYLLNIILFATTAWLLFMSMIILNRNVFVAFLFTLVLISYYPLFRYNMRIMMEIPTVFFLSLSIFLYTKYFYQNTTFSLYAANGVFAFLSLMNNRFIVLMCVGFIFLIVYVIVKRARLYKEISVSLLIALLIITPWFVRQFVYYDQFVFFTPKWHNEVADKIGLWRKINNYSYSGEDILSGPYSYDQYIESIIEGSSKGKQVEMRLKAFTEEKYHEIIKNHNPDKNIHLHHLFQYFTLYYKDFVFLAPQDYTLISPSSVFLKYSQIFILAPIYILALLGFILATKKKNEVVLLFSFMFLAHVILHSLVFFIDRYRLTAIPLVIIIASYSFGCFLPKSKIWLVDKLLET